MKNRRISALIATLLISVTALGSFSSCGKKTIKDNGYDATKANISVATYNGGVGYQWLEEAARRFEEKYKDATHFEEGKTGVKISVDKDKQFYTGENLSTSALTKDMYFTEGVDYYTFVNADKVADITDVVRDSLSTYGETGTIEAKLDDSFKSFLTAKDNKYYMLPFYDAFYGFVYDVDLFEEEGFYYDKEGDFLALRDESQRKEFEENKANGPDGKHGTYDDGLPATYKQFLDLLDQIVAKSCIPFCYSGGWNDYVNKACRAFIADYEGYDGFKLNYTFDGTAKLVKEIKADGSVVTEDVKITPENGYELQRQAGKYYALKMQEEIFGTVKYVGGSWNGYDYTVAQSEYIKSKYASTRYAMLVEGVWWENEATPTFSELEIIKGEKKESRRFGFMPMPKLKAELAGPQTMFSANSSFAFINKDCKNMKLAKEFMRFLHTDAEMSKFNAKTSISRSLKYEVKDEDKATATHFGTTLIDMRKQANVVYPYSSVKMVIDHPEVFSQTAWFLNSSIDGNSFKNPFDSFKNGQSNAKQYFDGLYIYQSLMWSNLKLGK